MIPAPYPWRCIRLPPCPEPLRPPSPALWDSLCIIRYRQKKVPFLTVLSLSFTANAAELLPAVVVATLVAYIAAKDRQ